MKLGTVTRICIRRYCAHFTTHITLLIACTVSLQWEIEKSTMKLGQRLEVIQFRYITLIFWWEVVPLALATVAPERLELSERYGTIYHGSLWEPLPIPKSKDCHVVRGMFFFRNLGNKSHNDVSRCCDMQLPLLFAQKSGLEWTEHGGSLEGCQLSVDFKNVNTVSKFDELKIWEKDPFHCC